MVKLATSYFYQIRNFKPWMIPVSTAISDPIWYRPPQGQEWFYDKRGIVNGLRYEYLIVQKQGTISCLGEHQLCPYYDLIQNYQCPCMLEYAQLLETLDFERVKKALTFCANKFHRPFDIEDPVIVLIVHESINNLCSERQAIQNYFTSHDWECKELEYPI